MSNAELTQTEAGHQSTDLDYMPTRRDSAVEIGLSAAIIAVHDNEPLVLVMPKSSELPGSADALPFGPFAPLAHRTLEMGLRSWVGEQTRLDLGYVEQLYTFADRGRVKVASELAPHLISIGYLALASPGQRQTRGASEWKSWYNYFPWEDWRKGRPGVLAHVIEPKLSAWAARIPVSASQNPLDRADRVRICFGVDGGGWDEEKVVERYELLYEAGLLAEAERDGRDTALAPETVPAIGQPMRFDHRRIVATAVARLRAKIKYRPLVFELMDEEFTLFELQRTVEAILGPHLHKQNFRRLVEGAGLVETTGDVRSKTGGRPAKLFRFRREVMLERPAPGVRVNPARN